MVREVLLFARRCAGKLLLEAAAMTHDRAARALRLCRQLRPKAEGNAGGGLLAGVLDRERQRTVRLLMLHRRNDDDDDDHEDDGGGGDKYGMADGGDAGDNNRCCCRGRRRQRRCFDDDDGADAAKTTKARGLDFHDCWSDDEHADAATVTDHCSTDQEEFAGIPGLDVDCGVLIRREYTRPKPDPLETSSRILPLIRARFLRSNSVRRKNARYRSRLLNVPNGRYTQYIYVWHAIIIYLLSFNIVTNYVFAITIFDVYACTFIIVAVLTKPITIKKKN